MSTNYIGQKIYVSLGQKTSEIKIPEIMELLKSETDMVIIFKDRIKFKTVVNHLIKADIEENLKLKFAKKLIGSPRQYSSYQEASEFVNILVKKHPEYKTIAKKVLLAGFDNMVKESSPIFIEYAFKNIMANIEILHFDCNDYKQLHNLFSIFEPAIKKTFDGKNFFNHFLKEKINYKDWAEFQQYSGKEIKKVEFSDVDFFSDNVNPKYELTLNKEALLQYYPSLSLGSDYNSVIQKIIFSINKQSEILNLDKCRKLEDDKLTTLYFVSKDDKEIDKEKIKNLISNLLELCAEFLIKKEDVNVEILEKAVEVNSLSFDLPTKDSPIKKLKI